MKNEVMIQNREVQTQAQRIQEVKKLQASLSEFNRHLEAGVDWTHLPGSNLNKAKA